MKLLLKLFVSMGFIFFVAGCKKDKTDTPQSTCKVTTIVSGGGSITVAYNNSGQISSVTIGDTVNTYSYSGSTITESILIAGQFAQKIIVTVNSAGLATNVKSEYTVDGSVWDNQAYEYDGNQASKITYTTYLGGSADVATFQWSDGNLVSITDGSDVTTFDYYTDKTSQPGDYLALSQLIQGYEVFRSKNMVKSITDGTDMTNITYVFDNDGKVTSLQGDDGTDQIAYGLSYQCN